MTNKLERKIDKPTIHILYYSIYMTFLQRQALETENRSAIAQDCELGKLFTMRGQREMF